MRRPAGLPPITEKAFMAQVIALAKLYGWLVFHPYDSRRSAEGYPDLTLVRERVIFAELKTDTGRLTTHQSVWLAALLKAGQEAYIWRPSDWDDIVRILKR